MFSGMGMFGAFGFDSEEETKKNEEMKREAELRKKYEENLDKPITITQRQLVEAQAHVMANNMKKADLIQYIRTLEHNYNVAVDFNIQQVKNFQRMEDRIVKELEGCSIVMSTESVPHRYFKAVSVKRAVDIVRRGGVSHGSK